MFEIFNSKEELINLAHGTLLLDCGYHVGKIVDIFKTNKKLEVRYLNFSFEENTEEIDIRLLLRSKSPLFYKLFKSTSAADIIVTDKAFKFVSDSNHNKKAVKIIQLNKEKESKGNYEKCVFSWLKYQELPPILASVAADYAALTGIESELKTLKRFKPKFNEQYLTNQVKSLIGYLTKEKWEASLEILRGLNRNKSCSLLDVSQIEECVTSLLLNYGYAAQGNRDFYRLCGFVIDAEIVDSISFRLLTQELE